MKALALRLVTTLLRLWDVIVPTRINRRLIIFTMKSHASYLPPDESLRYLFELQGAVYHATQQQASVYYEGDPYKYRLMNYQQFFVDRITRDDYVLDIGSGLGKLAYEIATQTDAKVVGIDTKESWFRIAQSQFSHPNIEYVLGDATAYIPQKSFSVIVMSNVLEHLPERPAFLQKVQQQTGAKRFLIRVPMFDRDWRVPLMKEVGADWRLDTDHETEYTVQSFTTEMQEAGLEIIYIEVRWGEIYAEVVA